MSEISSDTPPLDEPGTVDQGTAELETAPAVEQETGEGTETVAAEGPDLGKLSQAVSKLQMSQATTRKQQEQMTASLADLATAFKELSSRNATPAQQAASIDEAEAAIRELETIEGAESPNAKAMKAIRAALGKRLDEIEARSRQVENLASSQTTDARFWENFETENPDVPVAEAQKFFRAEAKKLEGVPDLSNKAIAKIAWDRAKEKIETFRATKKAQSRTPGTKPASPSTGNAKAPRQNASTSDGSPTNPFAGLSAAELAAIGSNT